MNLESRFAGPPNYRRAAILPYRQGPDKSGWIQAHKPYAYSTSRGLVKRKHYQQKHYPGGVGQSRARHSMWGRMVCEPTHAPRTGMAALAPETEKV
jgi:hypothetical protein